MCNLTRIFFCSITNFLCPLLLALSLNFYLPCTFPSLLLQKNLAIIKKLIRMKIMQYKICSSLLNCYSLFIDRKFLLLKTRRKIWSWTFLFFSFILNFADLGAPFFPGGHELWHHPLAYSAAAAELPGSAAALQHATLVHPALHPQMPVRSYLWLNNEQVIRKLINFVIFFYEIWVQLELISLIKILAKLKEFL